MRLRHIIYALCGGGFVLGCGFAEVFRSPTVGDVVLTYSGPTTMNVDDRLPFDVTVTVDGAPFPNPRVFITSSDTSILVLSPGYDSIIARARGFDTLTIKVVASIFTDSFPTIQQQVRVNP